MTAKESHSILSQVVDAALQRGLFKQLSDMKPLQEALDSILVVGDNLIAAEKRIFQLQTELFPSDPPPHA